MSKKLLPLLLASLLVVQSPAQAMDLSKAKEKTKTVVSVLLTPVRIFSEAAVLLTAETARLGMNVVNLMDPASDTNVVMTVDFVTEDKE